MTPDKFEILWEFFGNVAIGAWIGVAIKKLFK